MLTRDLTPCFVQDFGLGSRTGYEKALLVGLFDRTFTCLDHRISMRLFEKLLRILVENRRVRKSIEARRACRCRRSMR